MIAHGPGYIDRDNEVIVGLQTDAPFRRAIMPYGGSAMSNPVSKPRVESDPTVHEILRNTGTQNKAFSNAADTEESWRAGEATSSRASGRLRPRPHHR